MGISAHCGREVSLVNYFTLCVVRLGVTPVNYFGKINLADALQSLIQEVLWNSFSEFRNGIRRGLLLHLNHWRYRGLLYKFFECGLSSEKSTNLVHQECVLALKVHEGWKEL